MSTHSQHTTTAGSGRPASAGSLTVAFDIDGTWTLDPKLFHALACMFSNAGWQVIIVTGREQPERKIGGFLFWASWPVIVSHGELKERAAMRAGYSVNVWIDDMPGMIQECRILGGDLDLENAESCHGRYET